MEIKTLIILSVVSCFLASLPVRVVAQDKTRTDEPRGVEEEVIKEEIEVKQKITTPPLQLSEEEDARKPVKEIKDLGELSKGPKEPAAPGAPVGVQAPAAATPDGQVAYQPVPIKANKMRVELILDASGSMNGLMESTTKMAILKSAVGNIISEPLPEGVERELGLRVYGGQKPADKADCTDTELLLPIEPLDLKEFKTKVDSITALGVAPIGYALEEASKDFGAAEDVDNVIILITDGTDSCNADICEIAKKLHSGPKKIMINVLGYDLDQNAQEALSCVAKNSDGRLTIARNENELIASLDQFLMANIPYNLRLKIVSGATPLPANLKVYKAGTKRLVREDETTGTKYYQLPPGTYDMEVTYNDSLEKPAPSKLVKGVEVQATSKAEQVVQFDLGMLTLASFDQTGAPTAAAYVLQKVENPNVLVTFQGTTAPYTVWLTPGTYNIKVQAVTKEGLRLTASADGIKMEKGGSATQDFQFQVGQLKLTGVDAKDQPLPITYTIIPFEEDKEGKQALKEDKMITGTGTAEGVAVDLPPGKYKVKVSLYSDNIKDLPFIELDGMDIGGGDTVEKKIEIPTSTLTLIGKDNNDKATNTLFTVKVNGSKMEPAELNFTKDPITLLVSPGRYDIKAVFTDVEFEPTPTISWEAVPLLENQTLEKIAVLKFGTVNLFGSNSKNAPLESAFFIYNIGVDEPLVTLSNIMNPTNVKLTEGFYDIKAEDLNARSDPKPNIWFHNIEVKLEKPVTIKAVFTNGILKMICKGPNNTKLTCDYRVFTYGTDAPLLEGTTEENWREFDISPGNYYIEAGYHDAKDEVLLKKWITFKVADNEIVEQVIKF